MDQKGGECLYEYYSVKYKFTCITDFGEVEEKSSHYGLYMLGFTRATRVKTKGGDGVI